MKTTGGFKRRKQANIPIAQGKSKGTKTLGELFVTRDEKGGVMKKRRRH